MAETVLFHHAQGLTDGCGAFAAELEAGGHVVHVADLYEGATFADLAAGMAHAEAVGFATILERARAATAGRGDDIVLAGLSLGVMPAQMLAQTRPGVRGALLLHACIPPAEFGGPWPAGVPLQLHVMEEDALGDVAVAREVAATVPEAELFLYPGDRHLFTDRGLADHDERASALVLERARAFLAAVG